MRISFQYPRSGKGLVVKDTFAGRKGKCPECGGSVTVPSVRVAHVPVAAPGNARPRNSFSGSALFTVIWMSAVLMLLGVFGSASAAPSQILDITTAPRSAYPIMNSSRPSWSADGRRILFVVDGQIALMNADGFDCRIITQFGQEGAGHNATSAYELEVESACFSPDGDKIAFGAGHHVYVMNSDCSDIFQVCKGTSPRWTPDGKHILFEHGQSTSMTNTDGTQRHSFSDWTERSLKLSYVSYSPDGSKLAGCGRGRMTLRRRDVPSGLYATDRTGSKVALVAKNPDRGAFTWPCWSPDGKRLAFVAVDDVRRNLGIIVKDPVSGSERRLVEGDHPCWQPGENAIAFDRQGDVYVIDDDGTHLRRLTNPTPTGVSRLWGSHPRWSRDGQSILFRRGHYIWTAKADGTDQRCIIKGRRQDDRWPVGFTPLWSADGKKIIFTPYVAAQFGKAPEPELCTVNPDGTQAERIMKLQGRAMFSDQGFSRGDVVAWSPDGQKMAFDRNKNVWLANADGTDERRLAGGGRPCWSPDSKRILYVAGSERTRVLFVINADGSDNRQITDNSHGYSGWHSWAPDGSKVAFQGAGRLWTVSPDGNGAVRVCSGSQPCWSPDSRKILFRGIWPQPAGHDTICSINADGTALTPIMEVGRTRYGRNSIRAVSWSPDGERVALEEALRQRYEEQSYIWIVKVSDGTFYKTEQ